MRPIVFGKVQLSPKARQLIKHLVADGRFHFIETGSLVTLKTQTEDVRIPSEEERMALSSDFSTQKLYLADTGLLMTHALGEECMTTGGLYKAIFTGDVYFNSGMIAENAVAQSFVASGRSLFFYSRRNPESHRNDLEVDFLIRRSGKICPVEVKSGRYQSHVSLDRFRSKFGDRLGPAYILYTKDVLERDGIVHLPLYMTMFL